jgi:hypothetical protein
MRWLLGIPVLFMVGCSTYAELGQGHVARTLVSEERSAFGTNMGFSKLQHCEKNDKGEVSNCTDMTGWVPMWSQGTGGQVVGGALTGLGFGLGSAFSGASNSASAVSNAAATAGKGGHH